MIMTADPYSTDVLKLAASIEHLGRLETPQGQAHKTSRLCGSEIDVTLALDGDIVRDIGLEVSACALGQAAACVLSRQAIGTSISEIETARNQLHAMLKTGAPPPEGRFSELKALEPARDYPMRHGSVMLAFEAAVAAIEDAQKAAAE